MSCCGLGWLAALAPASEAAGSVTTLPANFVTPTSATLHGVIDTGGQPTSWTFQYGPVSGRQGGTYATAFQTIPASSSPMNYEAATIFRLQPNTHYEFRLVATFRPGTPYEVPAAGQLLGFTTKATGRVGLLSRRLQVAGGNVSVPLICRSQGACKGGFTILAATTGSVCAARSFTIRPGRQHTFFPRVRTACQTLLRKHPNHILAGRFTSETTTGQQGMTRLVKLIG